MAKKEKAELTFTAAQAAAFRLARHHLADRSAKAFALRDGAKASALRGTASARSAKASAERLVDVVRDTGGIQAQVMSAAEMALWTRRRTTTRAEIRQTLWERRDVVRTSAMRLTLHLIPASDLSTVIAALRPMSTATLRRWQERVGARPDQVAAMIETILEALGDGPKTQQELIARARKTSGKGVRAWLEHAWSAVRPAVIEGLIVYGPPRGAEATFVRVDTWLPKQRTVDVNAARAELLRRFLSAFGPATAHDFAKWSGLKTSDARIVLNAIGDELVPVSIDGARAWIRNVDRARLASSVLDENAVRLLGPFDPLLLAHATKEHLVEPKHYTRVYRPQGWISPVVLHGGTIAGVWFPKTTGKKLTLDVELFGRATPALREGVEQDAEAMGRFLGVRCDARFSSG